jgi:hypothetical protein
VTKTNLLRLLALVSLAVFAPTAAAAGTPTTKCGTETARTRGQVTNVRAQGTSCSTGRRIAGDWFYVQEAAKNPGSVTVHNRGRRWACGVTQAATGTDPGYIARTKVRCTHRSSVVTFELRS